MANYRVSHHKFLESSVLWEKTSIFLVRWDLTFKQILVTKPKKINLYSVRALKHYLNDKTLIHGRAMATISKFNPQIFETYFSLTLCCLCTQTYCLNVSVNSKPDHPEIRTLSLPGGSCFAQLSFPGGRGLKLEKFSTVLKEKCKNFLICFKETGGSLKSRCSCAVSCQKSRCPQNLK